MKSRILKAAFPLFAFMIAIFGAFAFSTAPAEKAANHFGAIPMPGYCEETAVVCTDIVRPNLCKQGTVNLYKISGSSCPDQLWKP